MILSRRSAVAAAGAAAVMFLSGCSSLADPTDGWDEPPNYTATITYQAYDIDAGSYRIVVRDHVPISFVRTDHRGVALTESANPVAEDFTLRQIVGEYQTAFADRESHEEILFDENDQVAEVAIDWQPLRITDEQRWIITDVRVD